MFKLMLAVVVVGALAADTEAPVLSLSLDATHDGHTIGAAPPVKGAVITHNFYTGAYTLANTHNFEDVCNVAGDGDCAPTKACVLPTPHAFDHHDGYMDADIVTTVSEFLASENGTGEITTGSAASSVDFTTRGMWRLDYAVSDDAGNAAEEISYVLVVSDIQAPAASQPAAETFSMGSSNTFATLASLTADDCLDGTITPTVADPMDYSICTVGERSEDLVWTDFAGLFGASYTSNSITFTRTIEVTDTIDPVLTIDDASKLVTTVECDTDNVPTTTELTTAASATLEACSCDSRETFYYSSTNTDCKISYTMGAITTTGDTNHNAGFTVAVTAKGYSTSSSADRSFTIVDTVAPTIDIDATITTNWDNHKNGDIGATIGGGTASFTNSENGENKYDGNQTNVNLNKAGAVIIQHAAGYTNDRTQIASLASTAHIACSDACDSDITATVEWSATDTTCAALTAESTEFSTYTNFDVGTYVFKYTCTDEANLSVSACRTVINQDHTLPVITIDTPILHATGCGVTDVYCQAASATATYLDLGAECSDQVDGVINSNVEVSGAVVDLKKVGTYVIDYNCDDSATNNANQISRTVVVFDMVCPTCAVAYEGSNEITVEASFPLDQGLTDPVQCSDDTTTGSITATQVGASADVELTGTYIITFTVTDGNGNNNFNDLATNACTICDVLDADGHSLGAAACNTNSQIRTVHVVDTLAPIITIEPNVSLMAESTQVNGWALGAIASAISGIALVGFGASRKSVATSVPV
jgi:hypothetical protein